MQYSAVMTECPNYVCNILQRLASFLFKTNFNWLTRITSQLWIELCILGLDLIRFWVMIIVNFGSFIFFIYYSVEFVSLTRLTYFNLPWHAHISRVPTVAIVPKPTGGLSAIRIQLLRHTEYQIHLILSHAISAISHGLSDPMFAL